MESVILIKQPQDFRLESQKDPLKVPSSFVILGCSSLMYFVYSCFYIFSVVSLTLEEK